MKKWGGFAAVWFGFRENVWVHAETTTYPDFFVVNRQPLLRLEHGIFSMAVRRNVVGSRLSYEIKKFCTSKILRTHTNIFE